MKLPRVQFTIAGMLWATFWMAVAVALFCSKLGPRYRWVEFELPIAGRITLKELVPLFTGAFLCPAVGAGVGKHRLGLLLGLCWTAGWFIWLGLYVAYEWWHSPRIEF